MTILYTASTKNEIGGTVTPDTTAGTFDPNFTDESLMVHVVSDDNQQVISLFHERAVSDITWYHFNCFIASATSSNAAGEDGFWFDIASDSTLICKWNVTNGVHQIIVYGDTTETSTSIPFPKDALDTFDIKVEVGANIEISVYINGTLQTQVSSANSGGQTKPNVLTFSHDDIIGADSNNYDIKLYYSEFIIADNESTLGWRLSRLKPASNGFHTQWQGDYLNILDGQDGLLIGSKTANQKESWGLTAYGGPAAVTSFRAVINKYSGNVGDTGPSQITPFVRVGGTDYESAAYTPDGSSKMDVLDQNPDTGVGWTTADLAALEVGVKSTT